NGIVTSQEQGNNVTVSVNMRGSGAVLDGTGSFITTGNQQDDDNGLFVFRANTTIANTANLTFTNSDPSNPKMLELLENVIVTNFGQITNSPDIIGRDGSSWINQSGGILSVEGELLVGTTLASNPNATLDAASAGNTVQYTGNGAQDIKEPLTSYSNLIIGGSGNKNMVSTIEVDELIDISGTLVTNNNDLTVQGNWTNAGSFNEGTSTVIFSGGADQTITNSVGEVFQSFTLDKTGGTLVLDNPLQVTQTLTMLQGTIDASSNAITLGLDAANEATLSYSNGVVLGEFRRFVDDDEALTSFVYPVGISGTPRLATLTFADITAGGIVSANFTTTAPGNDGLPLDDAGFNATNSFSEGYWEISSDAPNDIAFTTYDIALNGNGFTSFPISSDTRVLSRANASSPWVANGSHAAAVSSEANRTGISSSNLDFTLATNVSCDPPTTSEITASDPTPCVNSNNSTYSVTDTFGSDYDWSVTGGTIIGGNGTNQITVLWGSEGGPQTVEVVEDNSGSGGCGVGTPVTLVVDLNPQILGSITGRSSVAEGSAGVTYSVDQLSADYQYNWSISGGNITSATSGVNLTEITVEWLTNGAGSISVEADFDCANDGYGGADDATTNTQTLNVTIFPVIVSKAGLTNANWNTATNWEGDVAPQATNSARITGGSTFTTGGANVTIDNLEIETGTTIFITDQETLTITGDLTIDGTINSQEQGNNVALSVNMTGDGTILDGSGDVVTSGNTQDDDNPTFRLSGNISIASTADLTFTNSDPNNPKALGIAANRIVTNNGSITVVPDLDGGANSTWINATGSTLSVSEDLLAEATSNLNASQANNTVVYAGTGNQNIKAPVSST
ncbi:MAG: hypothetical protein HRT61_22115, partial [Ekhidna sp.]|nr:hypothetical protein [Ekhidna sp.]